MGRSQKDVATQQGIPSSKLSLVMISLCGILVTAHFIFSFFPHLRVWGINHLAYFPLYARIFLVCLTFSVFIPKVNRNIRMIIRKLSEFWGKGISQHKKYLWFAGLSFLSVIMFWMFRSRTYFLGDGYNYVANLDGGMHTSIWSEPLESLVYVQLHKFLNLFSVVDGHLTYQIGSILAGAIFVYLVFLLSDYLGRDWYEKFFVWGILAAMGTVQLFFGYVEHYAFVSVAILGYILSSLKWLARGGKVIAPVLLFLLSTAFHLSSLFLLPSLVYLLLLAGARRKTAKRFLILAGGVIAALALVSIYVYSSKPLLVRIFVLSSQGQFASGYTTFSSAHLLDVLNELLLLSPAAVILISATLLISFKRVDLKSPRISFLLLAAGFGFLFQFIFDPVLGAPRDWDMFSITSLGLTVLGICLFLNLRPKSEPLRYASLVVVFAGVFSLLPWIALNSSEAKSVQRFRDILELDPLKSKTGHYILTDYFGKRGMMQEVEEETRRQFEIYPHLGLAHQAMEYHDKGMPDTALYLLRQARDLAPHSSDVHYYLGKVHRLQGNLDSAETEYKQALKLKPENVYAGLELAVIYMQLKNWDNALLQYRKVLKYREKDSEVYYNMGIICLHQNRQQEALGYFRKAIEINHGFLLARCGLAEALSRVGRADEAKQELENIIESEPDFPDAYFHLGYLYRDESQSKKARAYWGRFLTLSKDSRKSEIISNALDSLENH
jgi:tetratricopeptide (TPR) repeat protein